MKFIGCINKADIECINALLSENHIFIELSTDIHKGKEEINWEGYYEYFPIIKSMLIKYMNEMKNFLL